MSKSMMMGIKELQAIVTRQATEIDHLHDKADEYRDRIEALEKQLRDAVRLLYEIGG